MEPSAGAGVDDGVERRRKRGRSIVLAAFLTVATVFILWSTVLITSNVFGASPELTADALSPACRDGLARLTTALDRAFPRGVSALVAGPPGDGSGEDAALRAFGDALLPEWADEGRVRSSCTGPSAGGGSGASAGVNAAEDSLTAVLRLKMAEETSLRRQAAELTPLRRSAGAGILRARQ